MKYCPYCNTRLVENTPVCPLCGKTIARAESRQDGSLDTGLNLHRKTQEKWAGQRTGPYWHSNTGTEKIVSIGVGVLAVCIFLAVAGLLVKSGPALFTNMIQAGRTWVFQRLGAAGEPSESGIIPTPALVLQMEGCSRSLEKCFADPEGLNAIFEGEFTYVEEIPDSIQVDLSQYEVENFTRYWVSRQSPEDSLSLQITLADMQSAVFSRPAFVEHFVEQYGVRWKESNPGKLAPAPASSNLPVNTWIFESLDGSKRMLGTSYEFTAIFLVTVSTAPERDAVLDGLYRLASEQIQILRENGY